VALTIDLAAPALELDENIRTVRQGMLGRLDLGAWRSSTKIEALIEELSNLRLKDATTKSIVFSQFVNFLDLIAYRLQKAGFSASIYHSATIVIAHLMARSVVWKAPCLLKLVMPLSNILVWFPS